MSSYFVNSTFPVTLPGSGQAAAESFLGQIPLYSSAYTSDSLRHYPGAAAVTAAAAVAYGAAGAHQEKQSYTSASNYYQQAANGAYAVHRAPGGLGVGNGACDYSAAAASFYREKEPTACGLEEHSLSLSQDIVHRKTECPGLSGKGLFGEMVDDKQSTTPVYPWMQRMNACNGKLCSLLVLYSVRSVRKNGTGRLFLGALCVTSRSPFYNQPLFHTCAAFLTVLWSPPPPPPPRHKTGLFWFCSPWFIVGAAGTAFDLPSLTHRKTCEDAAWKAVKISRVKHTESEIGGGRR